MDCLYPPDGRSFLCAYVDGLLVHTTAFEDHVEKLEKVFQRLELTGLSAKPSKCEVT